MSVKIKSRLPKGDRDGLQHLTDQLRRNPDTTVAVVMLLAPHSVTTNLDDQDDPITVDLKVLAIEAPQGLDASALRSLCTTAYQSRTGKQPLPFGSFLDEMPPASVDPDTGEIR